MTIEFADPGYNFLWLYIPLFITLLLIAAFIIVGKWCDWEISDPLFSLVGPLTIASVICTPVIAGVGGGAIYPSDVRQMTTSALVEEGFSNVQVVGDRFTAATEDGKYFEGVLVDLRPESGYAYRVLELTETGE